MYQAAKLPLLSAEMESRIWLWKDRYKRLVQQDIPLAILLTLWIDRVKYFICHADVLDGIQHFTYWCLNLFSLRCPNLDTGLCFLF